MKGNIFALNILISYPNMIQFVNICHIVAIYFIFVLDNVEVYCCCNDEAH